MMGSKLFIEDFHFDLPLELIAQKPASPRDSSRLMVLDRSSGRISHHHFFEFPQFLHPGDLLVRNNTRVLPSRIFARRSTGGRVEILLMHPSEKGDSWKGLVKGRKRLKLPQTLMLEKIFLEVEVVDRDEEGVYTLRFPEGDPWEFLPEIGYMPLPPYIKRDYSQEPQEEDRESYQTLYASEPGAYAAPTAGLHFTQRVLEDLKSREVESAEVTLHVGLGTFKPIQCSSVEDHTMHSEYYRIPGETLEKIQGLDRSKSRLLSVGTTTVRTLESFHQGKPAEGWTDIFIYPPYQVQSVDLLLTNFHLPGSSLLLLVSSFASWEFIREAYEIAIKERYRFFSYGDAMLII